MSSWVICAVMIVLVAFFVWRHMVGSRQIEQRITEGKAFLAENATRPEVTTTGSGLQLERLESGEGSDHPRPTNRVTVHYRGVLLDGTVFDSSFDRGQPAEFGLGMVIPGWTEGLQLMKEGDAVRLFIPPQLGYGNRNSGPIPGGSVLIFDVRLLKIHRDPAG